jgi:hypothetical protein
VPLPKNKGKNKVASPFALPSLRKERGLRREKREAIGFYARK